MLLAVVLLSVAAPLRAQVSGSITVYPTTSSIEVAATRQFTAYVPISPKTVTWLVNGTVGGNATFGTITAAGVYTPPKTIPANNVVTVSAKSTAYPSSIGNATMTITRPYPWLWSASPSPVMVGQYSVSFNGANFAPDSQGLANGVPVATTFFSATRLVVTGSVAAAGTLTFSVRQPGPGAVTGSTVSVKVVAANIAVSVAPPSAHVALGATQGFTSTVTGTPNTGVTWSVNGTAGGSSAVGTITSAGVYTAPAVMPASTTVTISATSAASAASFARATVTLTSPPPAQVSLSAARLLEQSSFGPTPASLARVQLLGMQAYLDEQFAMPETPIPLPANNSMGDLRTWMLQNYTSSPDQLRQRVAYSLSQIIVTSGNKLVYANEMLPWLRLLSQHAFGNYRDLLRDTAMSPSMGKYLDLARSMKPGMAGGANENFARELMQLFSIGLWRLNQDGSLMVGPDGQPMSTYDQSTVRQLALALTGWVYVNNAYEDFSGPMLPKPVNHDTSAKAFLGCSLPANQSVEQDLDGVIDCLMQHPNTAPFVATRLIRSLVTSNPSPQYVMRVADVFAGAQSGVRGDLKATVLAILTDPDARQDVAPASGGRLKEPILQTAGLLRALNGGFSSTNGLAYLYDYMSQSILTPPSVFSWFSPLYRAPNTPLFGPEFQIYSPSEATLRGNVFYGFLTSQGADTTVDLSPFQPYGNDMPALVEAANQVLLYGRMPAPMKQAIIAAAAPGYDAHTRIVTVLYLTVLSGQYAVQY